ncbi:TRAP transporter permease [Jeotgalibacillus proteolyticus]|uniref:C4-dicarboxylate ABC transporter permease n=1 Tax=Jeotgalibacillus proteolyticus TaxID=2082395 RepID=A0A2S5GCW2_9BACL|nr:TRAP transporter permease [Jeotgalibacillus proteolyticus]PPA70829.1 C4-dicarboxylate ABC transporter permease [Jeotgalibacillus proteolyticus]
MEQNTKTDAIVDNEAGGGLRDFTGGMKIFMLAVAAGLSIFAIYTNGFSTIQEIYRNGIFLGFLLTLTFLLYPITKKSDRSKLGIVDILFIVLGLAGVSYIVMFYTTIHVERSSQAITQDYIFAVILILVLLEASRRAIGIFIPLLSAIAIIYAMFGPYFPGMFGHAGFSIERLLYRMYMTTEGIFGMTLSIASTYIVLFILFGAFLTVSGASQFFNELAMAIAGRRRGGPAQVAVISSALTGSLSGSAVANVATTGSFTIPLMKGIGLKPRFAGAVEAAASTGGMIMPPIMGAAAFIMAGFLGVSYSTIILAAIIPSILYYASLIIAIDLEAKKQGLKGMSKESIPLVKKVLLERGVLLLPILIVIGALLLGRTPLFAGFAGIISVIIASWLTRDKSTRVTPAKAFQALVDGARGSIQVGIACASIGIIISVVTMTGLGSTFAYNILNLAGGTMIIILLLVMVTCIVLSLGLPSTALYIIVAVTAAPALINAGINPLAAHFFVFWFGALSNVTPPVALAAYTAAGIAGADAMKTSWTALRLALPGFIVPFMIAYNPILIMQDPAGGTVPFYEVIIPFLTALIGIFGLAISINNFLNVKLNIIERLGFFAGAMMLIKPGLLTDGIGIGILGLMILFHFAREKKITSSTVTT